MDLTLTLINIVISQRNGGQSGGYICEQWQREGRHVQLYERELWRLVGSSSWISGVSVTIQRLEAGASPPWSWWPTPGRSSPGTGGRRSLGVSAMATWSQAATQPVDTSVVSMLADNTVDVMEAAKEVLVKFLSNIINDPNNSIEQSRCQIKWS